MRYRIDQHYSEDELRKWSLIAALGVLLLVSSAAFSQQITVGFGGGATQATPASSVSPTSTNYSPQSVAGGTFLHVNGEFIFHKKMGIGGEIAWRASRSLYAGTYPYRPLFWDFNGVYSPWLGKHAAASLQAGIGAESARFYQPFQIGTTNYVSSNHFLGHFGGALRLYKGNFFVGPEVHAYLIRNNREFSGPWVTRYAVSLGYTFRSEY